MVEEHFALARPAFSKAADPRFFFPSGGHEQACAHLLYAAEAGEVALLTGEVGCGKTTVVRVVCEELASRGSFVLVAPEDPRATPAALLRAVGEALAVPPSLRTRDVRVAAIARAVRASGSSGRTVVVVCDEAHLLPSPSAFEELRLLTNVQGPDRLLVSVLLVGQPELQEKLRHPSLRALRQRIALRFHLQPLSEEDTQGYVRHRLSAAGAGTSSVFTAPAILALHRLSGGVPRVLNTLATHAMVQAMAEGRREVDADVVAAIAGDPGWAGAPDAAPEEGIHRWWT